MKIVFMGTPDFAVQSLAALVEAGHEVIGVVTQPDRAKGRGNKVLPSPVKAKALELGLQVYQPEKVKSPEFVELLRGLAPDVIIVVAYGQLLSAAILDLPAYGCINVHASLLPKYRGAAPIHWAVIEGNQTTGVTTMLMDRGLDTGNMLLKATVDIAPAATVGMVHDQLAVTGAELLVRTLEGLAAGTIVPEKQVDEDATYAKLLEKADEELDWSQSAENIRNHIRGMNPWPGTFTRWDGKVLKVFAAKLAGPEIKVEGAKPGQVIRTEAKAGVLVQTGSGQLWLKEVQLQGGKRMTTEQFLCGNKVECGTIMGE